MTLGFTTVMNGSPNFFVEKIWQGLFETQPGEALADEYSAYLLKYTEAFGGEWDGTALADLLPKHHSVRRDRHSRWRAGLPIHFVVNNRTPQRFQFAPVLTCRLVQRITFEPEHRLIRIDDRVLENDELTLFANNDGFATVDALFSWFTRKFTGSLIHWTGLSY